MTVHGPIALILVGHGSARHPEAAAPILALAEGIRARGIFDEVACAFMKQAPLPELAGRLVRCPTVVVVPVFAGKGYYTDILIPQAMGLSGPVSRIHGRTWLYTAAAGTHPRLPDILSHRAEMAAAGEGLDPHRAALLLIAHGSSRDPHSGDTALGIADAIAQQSRFAEVAVCFLEQEPRATRWPELIAAREVIALPLLVARGTHASEDIPPLFGLSPGATGAVDRHGHRVRLVAGLGAEAELIDLVLELAEAALAG